MHILYALIHLILWYSMKYLFCFLFINAECHLLPAEGDKSKTVTVTSLSKVPVTYT